MSRVGEEGIKVKLRARGERKKSGNYKRGREEERGGCRRDGGALRHSI